MVSFTAGQTPTADDLNFLVPLFAYKAADESVASNTSPQNDNDLVLSYAANAIYTLDMLVMSVVAGSIVDMNMDFTFGATAELGFGVAGPDISLGSGVSVGTGQWASAPGDTSSPSATIALGSGSVGATHLIRGLLTVGATSGSLQWRWAQNASSGTSLIVKAGSWMMLRRVA